MSDSLSATKPIALEEALARISELEAENSALRKTADKSNFFEQLIQHTPGFFYECLNAKNWKFLDISPQFNAITGFNREDFINNETFTFSKLIHPEDIDRINREVDEALEKDGVFQVVYRILKKDGSEAWCWEQGTYKNKNDKSILIGYITDISDTKKLQNSITQQQLTYLNAFSNAQTIMVQVDAQNQIEVINDFGKQLFGIDNMPTCTFNEILAENSIAPSHEEINDLLREPNSFETMFVAPNNNLRTIVWRCSVNTQENKKVYIGLDITDNSKLQNQLIEYQEKFQIIEKHSTDFVVIFKGEELFYISPKYLDLLGVNYTDIQRSDVLTLLNQWVHPDDLSHIQTQLAEAQRKKPKTLRYRYRLNTKNHGIIWREDLLSFVRNEEGVLEQIVVNSRDVSDAVTSQKSLELVENRLKTILTNSSNIAVQIFNEKGKIKFWNQASETMYGFKEVEAVGKTFEDLFLTPQENKELLLNLADLKLHPEKTIIKEFEALTSDGKRKYILSNIFALGGPQNELEFVCLDIDISAIKHSQHELELAKEKAEKADRLKSVFLANMSHEVRTPMNAILGYAQYLELPDLSEEEKREAIYYINKRSNDLLALINDILDVSRLETGEFSIYKNNFLAETVLKDVHQLMSTNNKKEKVNIHLDLNDLPAGFSMFSDADRIKQILINLVDNAVKFTEEGTVLLKAESTDNNEILLTVTDSGIGIPSDKLPYIFDPFRQAHEKYTTRKFGGTGLGLSIVKGIVRLLNGSIWLQSEEQKGTKFYVKIPCFSQQVESAKQLKKASYSTLYKWNYQTVLLVEDDEINADIIEKLLTNAQLNVIKAASGAEVHKLLNQKQHFDLVLLDIQLPDTDGLKLIPSIRAQKSMIPIIAQTAYASDNDELTFLQAGCNYYLSKPIAKDKLYKTISMYISSASSKQE